MGVKSAMLEAKKRRQRAESDVQLLANRLQHLHAAEAKAKKKIADTRERTATILSLKQRTAQYLTVKARQESERDHDVSTTQRRVSERRHANRATLAQARHLIEEARREAGTRQRQRLRELSQEKHQAVNDQLAKNRQRQADCKRQRQLVRSRLQAARLEKQAARRAEYERAVDVEAARQRDAEAIIQDMAQQEAAMIRRLQEAHDLQQAAYQALRDSLHDDTATPASSKTTKKTIL